MTSSWRIAVFSKRLLLVALVFLALPLLAEFNTRLAVSRQLFEEEARLQREIEAEQARTRFLADYQQYVQTDAYVEWWARGARMTRPGEVAVIPVLPPGEERALLRPASKLQPRDFAGEWWAAFFARSP